MLMELEKCLDEDSSLPQEVDYPEFSIALSLLTAFYQQVPPKFHLFNPLCKACRDKVEPSMKHEDYCYNQIPF